MHRLGFSPEQVASAMARLRAHVAIREVTLMTHFAHADEDLTEIEKDEYDSLDEATKSDPGRWTAQIRLAEWMTQLVHGDEGLNAVNRASKILFGGEIGKQTDASLGEIFADVPSQDVERSKLGGEGYWIVEALQDAGLVTSSSEARRAVKDGGAYVNNVRATDMNQRLTEADLASETVMVLRKGKRNYALLRFS